MYALDDETMLAIKLTGRRFRASAPWRERSSSTSDGSAFLTRTAQSACIYRKPYHILLDLILLEVMFYGNGRWKEKMREKID